MFARTGRLLIRPGWADDAAALFAAAAFEEVTRMTGRMPWPYAPADAASFLARPPDPRHPDCLVFLREHDRAAPRLIGGVGLYDAAGAWELGYWLTPTAWGCGYATEAAGAMLRHARDGLRVAAVQAGHFCDNPASGAVLRKLGFVATGTRPYPSLARGGEAMAVRYRLELARPMLPVAA